MVSLTNKNMTTNFYRTVIIDWLYLRFPKQKRVNSTLKAKPPSICQSSVELLFSPVSRNCDFCFFPQTYLISPWASPIVFTSCSFHPRNIGLLQESFNGCLSLSMHHPSLQIVEDRSIEKGTAKILNLARAPSLLFALYFPPNLAWNWLSFQSPFSKKLESSKVRGAGRWVESWGDNGGFFFVGKNQSFYIYYIYVCIFKNYGRVDDDLLSQSNWFGGTTSALPPWYTRFTKHFLNRRHLWFDFLITGGNHAWSKQFSSPFFVFLIIISRY